MKLRIPPGTLRAAFAPVSIVALIFGMDIFHYPKDKPRPLLSAIWALLLVTIDVILVKMSELTDLTEFMGSKIGATNYRFFSYIQLLCVAKSMFDSQFKTQTTRSIFRNLITINARMKTMGIPDDYRLAHKTQIIELSIGFTYMIVLQILDFLYIGLDYPGQAARISFLLVTHHFLTFFFILDFTYTSFVRKIHRDLCNTAMDLNRVNGIQVLLSVGLSFGLITSLLYTAYDLEAEAPLVSLSQVTMIKCVTATWAIYYILKLAWFINACATTSSEARRTGELIHSFSESTLICGRDIRDEVNIFTLQLIQNPLTFTAGGLFTLDHSLFQKMIGSVTTYLVIMIQMRSIYETQHIRNNSTLSTALVAGNNTG